MKKSRLAEGQIIGFFKQADAASPASLGRYSGREHVRESGLWNNNYVDEAYDPANLEILERVVSTIGPLT